MDISGIAQINMIALNNDLTALSGAVLTGLVVYVVNNLARHYFQIKEDTYASYAVNALTFTAVLIPASYLLAYAQLTPYSDADIADCALEGNMIFFEGMIIGYYGHKALVTFAAVGAFFGSLYRM